MANLIDKLNECCVCNESHIDSFFPSCSVNIFNYGIVRAWIRISFLSFGAHINDYYREIVWARRFSYPPAIVGSSFRCFFFVLFSLALMEEHCMVGALSFWLSFIPFRLHGVWKRICVFARDWALFARCSAVLEFVSLKLIKSNICYAGEQLSRAYFT